MPYKCISLSTDIQADNLNVSLITGQHHYRKSNSHVRKLEFCRHFWSKFLPNGFGKMFPNLSYMEVRETPLMALKRSNFAGMSKLIVLYIDDTKILSLPNDLFADMKSLKELTISKSFVTILPANIFLPLESLKLFNGKYNKISRLSSDLFRGNPLMESINLIGNDELQDIKIDFTKLNNITEIYLFQCGCINSYYLKSSPTFTLIGLQYAIKIRCSNT